jgi:hypothetical protein
MADSIKPPVVGLANAFIDMVGGAKVIFKDTILTLCGANIKITLLFALETRTDASLFNHRHPSAFLPRGWRIRRLKNR